MPKAVCVFCSSSSAVEGHFFDAATELGAQIGRRGHELVFGGAEVGLMGVVARAVHREGGRVVGVIPDAIHRKGIAYQAADELIVTPDLRDRKTVMEQRSDAFVALPGGFGTLEELFEMLVLRQLGYHQKPVVLLNTERFFDPLLEMFERLFDQRFAKPQHRELCRLAPTPDEALGHLENSHSPPTVEKWFDPKK